MENMSSLLWIRLRVEAPPPAWDAVAAALERIGCQGVELLDAPPAVVGYLPKERESLVESFKQRLQEFPQFGLPPVSEPEVTVVESDTWQRAWKRFFRSRKIGERIRVQPSWSAKRPQAGEILILLDPGMAFGTGSHPTTALCLELMQQYLKPGDRVADLGCGTGILSIAAVRLGASEAQAVDSDPLSVLIANENTERNEVAAKIAVREGDGWNAIEGSFDFIVCNILSSFLIQTASQPSRFLKPNGYYLVSGVIGRNWRSVARALEAAGLHPVERRKRRQWVAAIYQKP